MPLFYEADDNRKKGVEFDLLKNAKDDKMKSVINADPNVQAAQAGQGNAKLATTSRGVDINDSKLQSRVESFDKEKAKYILESKNIVEAYNAYIEADIDRLMDENSFDLKDGTTDYLAKTIAYLLKTNDISKSDIRNYLRGTFFYTSNDPEKIKRMLTLRLKYNQHITNLMSKMLNLNYKILGYTDAEMKALDKRLNSKGNDSNTAVAEIKQKIYENKSKFLTNNGECVDLTSLGFGKIFITKGKDFLGINNTRSGKDDRNELQAIDGLLQKSMMYDAIIMCHGSSGNKITLRELEKQLKDQRDLYKKMGYDDSELEKLQSFDRDGKKMADDNNESLKNRWIMQPIRSDKSDYYTDMNSFVARLIKEGYKKILIAACNPGSHKLDSKLLKIKGVKILYSDYSNIIENTDYEYDLDNEFDVALLEGENELIQISESYGFYYYDNLDFDIDEYIVNEGVIDNLKEYAIKVVKFIVGLFKKLWGMIKRFASIMKEKFTGRKDQKIPDDKKVKLSLIMIENAKLNDYEIKDRSIFESLVQKSTVQLEKEVQKRQMIQNRAAKQLADHVNRMEVQESYVIDEEAEYSSKNRFPIYIVAMHSGTVLANIIKKVTGDEFSHVCISFNSKLDPLYSFGSKELGARELGFVKQSPSAEFYKQYKAHYKVYVAFVDKTTRKKMIERLQWFNDNDKKLSYDLFGLVKKLFNKDTENHTYKYFCSRFVAEILGKGGLELNKVASLYTPQDLTELKYISLVNAGEDFFKYNAKNTENNLKKIKNKIFDTLTFSESYDSYEVYKSYRLEKEYKNPDYCCWDEEMYYPDMKTALGHIYAEGIDNGDFHVYTDLGCGKCKYLGKIQYYSKDNEINYTWITKTNQIKNLIESNTANMAMVPSAGVFIHNCMKKNTFVDTPDDDTEYIVSRDGMSDIFRFGEKGEKIKLTREEFENDYDILNTYQFMESVSNLRYFNGILESNTGYDFYLNMIGYKSPKEDLSYDIRFESVPSFFDELNLIQKNIMREYYFIRNNKSIIEWVDKNIQCLIEKPYRPDANVSVNEWSGYSDVNLMVSRLKVLQEIIPKIY